MCTATELLQNACCGRLYKIREWEISEVITQKLFQQYIAYYTLLQNSKSLLSISGVVLPVWNPQNPSVGDKVARAIVYFVALIYMFLGMSIIADRFMSSIEVSDT